GSPYTLYVTPFSRRRRRAWSQRRAISWGPSRARESENRVQCASRAPPGASSSSCTSVSGGNGYSRRQPDPAAAGSAGRPLAVLIGPGVCPKRCPGASQNGALARAAPPGGRSERKDDGDRDVESLRQRERRGDGGTDAAVLDLVQVGAVESGAGGELSVGPAA